MKYNISKERNFIKNTYVDLKLLDTKTISQQLIEEALLYQARIKYFNIQDTTYISFHTTFTFAKKSIDFRLFRYSFLFSFLLLYNKTFENITSKKIDELINRKDIYFRRILKNNLVNIKYNKKIKRR